MTAQLLAVALYFAALAGIGYAAARRTKTLRDDYAGGKRMGFWAVACSARATASPGSP